MVNKNNSKSKNSIRTNDEPALTIYPVDKLNFLKQMKNSKIKNGNLNKTNTKPSESASDNTNQREIVKNTAKTVINTIPKKNAQNEKPKLEVETKPICEDSKVFIRDYHKNSF